MHVFSFLCVIFPRRPGLLHTGSFLSKSDRRLSPKLIVPWLIYSLLHFSQQSQFIIIELENVSVSYYEKFKFDDNWLMLENYAFSRVELVVPKFALWTEVAHWNPSKWTCFDFSEQRFIEITDGLSIDALRFTDESENDSFRSWCIWNTETSPTKSRHWTSARWHVVVGLKSSYDVEVCHLPRNSAYRRYDGNFLWFVFQNYRWHTVTDLRLTYSHEMDLVFPQRIYI